MKPRIKMKRVLVATAFRAVKAVFAQDALHGTLTMGMADVAQIKQKAEAGDPAAQVSLVDSLASSFHASEALQWYHRAAAQGSVGFSRSKKGNPDLSQR